jgi:hypothetical protein
MTDTPINPDVVELITGLSINSENPRDWTHRDGRPLTDKEQALLGTATRADLQAAREFNQHRREHHQRSIDFGEQSISYRHGFGALSDMARYALRDMAILAEYAPLAGTVLTLEALTEPDSVLDALIALVGTAPGELAHFEHEGADVVAGHLRAAAESFAAGLESLRRAAPPRP